MNEPSLTYLSRSINDAKDSDDECIKSMLVSDQVLRQAIKKHRKDKDNINDETTSKTPIVTGDEIQQDEYRQMMDNLTNEL